MKFAPYQKNWIEDTSRQKILVKSRRIGGTFSTANAVFRRLMAVTKHDITVITYSMSLAHDFVREVQLFARAWNLMKPPSEQIPEHCFTKTSFEIPHAAGTSRLIAVSSNPDSAIGKGGDVVIDEMAVHKNQKLLELVTKPIITAGGRLTILSTHRSKSSHFNYLVKQAEAGENNFSVHKTTVLDAVDQGFVELYINPNRIKLGEEPLSREEWIDNLKNDVNDDAIWDQEYMCIPSEKQYQLITIDLLNDAIDDCTYDLKDQCFLGWDIATSESGDYSCITIVQRTPDNKMRLVKCDAQKGMDLADQRNLIKDYVKKYKVKKMALDATGLGIDSAQILEKHYGKYMCEGVTFNMKSKHEMASRMLDIFQSHNILIPDDAALIKDVNSVEKVYGASGNITYQAPRLDGSHGDRFWSLSLALRAAGWSRSDLSIRGLSSSKVTPVDVNRDRVLRNKILDSQNLNKSAF